MATTIAALSSLSKGNSMADVKEHPMFEGMDWEQLRMKMLPAPWIPPKHKLALGVERSKCATSPTTSYKGNQVKT